MKRKIMMFKSVNSGKDIFVLIIIGVVCLSSQVAMSGTIDLTKSIQKCSEISSNQQRLSCFDQLAEPLINSSAASTANVVEKITPIVVVKTEQAKAIDDFAKEHIEKTDKQKTEEIQSIELTISELKKLIRGEWVITFENGQKWQQKDSTHLKLAVGGKVILAKGTFSAIYLKKVGSNKRMKVKRLK